MKIKFNYLLLSLFCCLNSVFAQQEQQGILISGNVYCEVDGPVIAANVLELDNNNRFVSASVTDINGNFSMRIINSKNKLQVSYMGFQKQTLEIGQKRTFNIKLIEDNVLQEVVVTSKTRVSTSGLVIPDREISMSRQFINADQFKGLSFISIDDALQGQVSGLDIVSISGNVGSGSRMRMRGVTSINANTEPLIVVNDVIFETPYSEGFDFTNANEEQFAQLLTINPDDIESITVLKDAAATAIWGSRGANGVLYIKTRRGARGKTSLQYSYRFSGAYQPKGLNMLNGDDYTMLLKESYFNPRQSNAASNIRELNYDPTFSEYQNFNNNTDWVKEVQDYGRTHSHYISIAGGGEKALFRVSGGYDNQTGSVIGQFLDRFSTRLALDYYVSDKILFTSNFALTYTDNRKNYDNILGIAYKKMPNQSVYQQDEFGNNTDTYYQMLQNSSPELGDQRGLGNPVAIAMLAQSREKNYRIDPYFKLRYDLLSAGDGFVLRYEGDVAFGINNNNISRFRPKDLTTANWTDGNVNKAELEDNRSLGITTRHTLNWRPKLSNEDHYLTMLGRLEVQNSTSRNQKAISSGLPSGSITSPTVDGYLDAYSTGKGHGRSIGILYSGHYSYKSKYIVDFSLRRDGSTKYGSNRKWGNFPAVSLRWNLIDEPFMASTQKWLSMLSIRPSWGTVGNPPGDEYLHFSRYGTNSAYIDMPGIKPNNVRLTDLRWEKTTSKNIGADIGLWNDMLTIDFNYYDKITKDLLMKDRKMPSSSGFDAMKWKNVGTMNNKGWDLAVNTGRIVKSGAFAMSFNFNLGNNVNTIIDMEPTVLASLNSDFTYRNGEYLTRVQLQNPYGSIYGFRYKGVYQYNDYIVGEQENAPVARDVNGRVVFDNKGNVRPMYFAYGQSAAYQFKGGDAIYEDINNDGNINELDIVYLGNSNPLLNGGFGAKFYYKQLMLNVFFNFRYGNDIVNEARMNAENMYTNNNQSIAVNWRWRKDGDITEIPRALYNVGYNWLPSDRFVEDGSFLRMKYVQLSYNVPPKLLKKYALAGLTISVTADNLFCLTKYTGVDPEVGYGGFGISRDNAQTPRAKSYTANINISF
ncbi:SusC/RagA family TonB-linked outer membrane protein [Viscerimonas tarda]